MRLDSPFVLAIAGTLAIHTILVVAVDAVVVIYPHVESPPAPRVELVDVEVPEPPPEPPKPPPPAVKPPEPVVPQETPKPTRTVKRIQEPPPAPTTEPPKDIPVTDTPGGDEVVQMADIAPAAHGVAVKVGKPNTGHVGRGGSGGGTGAGSGAGTADEPPPPVSVATIKTRALPKGDYSYFNTGTDYPPAAKQLGIEGDIRVKLVVDDKGKVKSAELLNRLGHGLDQLAMTRARQIEFEPAKDTDDRAVTSVVVWTFHMTLPK